MEITTEIKIKVFSQYIGQIITLNNGKTTERLTIHLFDKYITNGLWWLDLKLILKPQSTSMACNEEERISMKKIESITEELMLKNTDKFSKDDFVFKMMCCNFLSYQYAISKGIDLPNYLLDGKTLHESGLAIYE